MWIRVKSLDYYKNLHLIYCSVLVTTGAICIFAGITSYKVFHLYERFLPPTLLTLSNILATSSILSFIATVLCYQSAYKRSKWLMSALCIILGMNLSLQLSTGTNSYILNGYTKGIIGRIMMNNSKYYRSQDVELSYKWDIIQMEFQCCGVKSYNDWTQTIRSVPISCCRIWPGILKETKCDSSNVALYRNGCLNKFSKYITDHTSNIGKMGIFSAILQFVGFALTVSLYYVLSYFEIKQRQPQKPLIDEKIGVFSI